MAPQVVYRRERQLVLVCIAQLLVVRHELTLIEQLVRHVEQQPILQGALAALLRGLLRLVWVHLGYGQCVCVTAKEAPT